MILIFLPKKRYSLKKFFGKLNNMFYFNISYFGIIKIIFTGNFNEH